MANATSVCGTLEMWSSARKQCCHPGGDPAQGLGAQGILHVLLGLNDTQCYGRLQAYFLLGKNKQKILGVRGFCLVFCLFVFGVFLGGLGWCWWFFFGGGN